MYCETFEAMKKIMVTSIFSSSLDVFKSHCCIGSSAFLKRQILDSVKLKEFAGDNFRFDENGRKFSIPVENTAGEGEIVRYEQFLPFPQCFQRNCTADT